MEANEFIEENTSKSMILIGGAVLALAAAFGLKKIISWKFNRSESTED